MKLKKLLPVTNGTRHQIKLQKNLLVKKNRFLKSLLKKSKSNKGRSSQTGHITVRHKSNGCKYKLHVLNSLSFFYAINICHMYSSTTNTFIALNFDFLTKSFFKTISTANIFPGSFIISNFKVKENFIGYRTKLKYLPIGSVIHSISLENNIIFCSSAGTYASLLEKNKNCKIRLPSGVIITVPENYFAVLGSVSNDLYKSLYIGKAGRNRLKGIRPSVRGVAMNPVDHPHGGRTNGGRPSVTPWGIPTKGKPTVKK
jgi:large subunit ribosomal protein L2